VPTSDRLSETLVAEAEREAEQLLGLLRVAIAVALLVWVTVSVRVEQPTQPTSVIEPFRAVTVALGGFLFVGLASFALARAHLFRPWMAFAVTAADAAVLSLGLFVVLKSTGLGGNWLSAVPGVWLAPVLLSLGAVRYRPAVQVWATALLLLGLVIAVVLLGFDPDGPLSGASPQLDHFFSIAPSLIRGGLLALTGLITALVMHRGRALLLRAVVEISRRAQLSRFLPGEIAPLVEPGRLEEWRQGRRQQVTILFIDMRDSTTLAEHMDPKRLSVFMAAFRRRVSRAVKRTGGVVDKFIGDGALVVFGVPQPRSDDAARALVCARELLREIDRWNLKHGFVPPVRVGIGVHSGKVFCGLIGDEARLEFTVLGDAVNVASRIEEATKRFHTPVLASETVLAAAGELEHWILVTSEPMRGRAEPIKIFAPSAKQF
jgi:adenylate cyclase